MTVADWVLLARIVRPQGRRGEVLADLFTDFPEHFSQRKRLFLRAPRAPRGEVLRETKVDSHWLHKGRVVLKFSQVDSMTEAEMLRGFEVVVPHEERIPLTGDAVYVSDLLGLMVVDVRGGGNQDAGEIVDVEPEGPGPAMLVVRTAGGTELLIPFVKAYLKNVDYEARRLHMDLPEGLLDMQAPVTQQYGDAEEPPGEDAAE